MNLDHNMSQYQFDMSISTLMRLNYHLMLANNHSGTGNFKEWFTNIQIVDREIDPLLKEEERKILQKLKNKITPGIGNNKLNLNIQRNLLDDYERNVRRFVHKYKLYMKESDDAGTSILR